MQLFDCLYMYMFVYELGSRSRFVLPWRPTTLTITHPQTTYNPGYSPLKASGYSVQLGHHPEVVHGNMYIIDGTQQHLVLMETLHVYQQMSLFHLQCISTCTCILLLACDFKLILVPLSSALTILLVYSNIYF